jgi:multidrug efflux pump subunit AcrB
LPLTGTLATAGFVPVGLNNSSAGEYTFTLFGVIASALLISWVVAVLLTPLLGVTILPETIKQHGGGPGRFRAAFGRLLLGAVFHSRWSRHNHGFSFGSVPATNIRHF